MTPQEAVKEITSKLKWYMVFPYLEHKDAEKERDQKECQLRVMALRILNGTAKPESMKRFFEHFGYEYRSEVIKKEI